MSTRRTTQLTQTSRGTSAVAEPVIKVEPATTNNGNGNGHSNGNGHNHGADQPTDAGTAVAEHEAAPAPRLPLTRVFSKPDTHPFDELDWEQRSVSITDDRGKVIFEQKDVEVPKDWSPLATKVVVSKYFYGDPSKAERERSIKNLVHRVCRTIADWGIQDGYFDQENGDAFYAELCALSIGQYTAFNSPVWFNTGLFHQYGIGQNSAKGNWFWNPKTNEVEMAPTQYEYPQTSACLPYEARINTDRGLIPIGEINNAMERGVSLCTWDKDGKKTKITAAICNGKRHLISLELSDGSNLRLTGTHKIFVKRNGETIEIEAKSAQPGQDDMLISRLPLLPTEPCRTMAGLVPVTPDMAWLAGLLNGNGFRGRPKTASSDIWEIKLNTDAERNRIEEILSAEGLSYAVQEANWGFCIRGYGENGKAFWNRLGMWSYTNEKHTPEWVYRADKEIVANYLRGLLDTNGAVFNLPNNSVTVNLSNTNRDIVEGAQVLLRSLGIVTSLTNHEDKRTDSERQTLYTLNITEEESTEIFAKEIGLTHTIKANRLAERRKAKQKGVEAITITGINWKAGGGELVYDIETEAHTFWVEGLLVHNCFIQSVEDNMQSILNLVYSEGMLFKFGSGTGSDLSPLRSSREKLSGGGKPSGPLSFLRIYDQVANVVKSGGKTRRAAKMNILRDTHGDIEDFIDAKSAEEKKAWALMEQGYDGSFGGEAYNSIMFQNENLSVRVSDEFMRAAMGENNGEWWTYSVTSGKPLEKKDARQLLQKIAEGTWICGDPGLQFDTTINRWHTCKGTEPIYASNPCSEYLFLNNTACNLSSLNLMKFKRADGKFDVERFRAAARIMITAQEILVDRGSYPTKEIAANSHHFRTLGLGYANLGSLIMSYGLSYDSNEGRALAGAVTAIMTGEAYYQSALLAAHKQPFGGYRDPRCINVQTPKAQDNVASMLEVIGQHRAAVKNIQPSAEFGYLKDEAVRIWEAAESAGKEHGYRNAQVTVLAPTGTIGFMMDCGTTGIEPDIALVKYKQLAGGGMLKIVNRTVPEALNRLGYSADQIKAISTHVERFDTIEDVALTEGDQDVKSGAKRAGEKASSGIKPEHISVFDCAFKAQRGVRHLEPMAHLRMMAAAQPFISGGISKTVNMPTTATVDDIKQAYIEAWKMGLKCVAIYRDGSKRSQPLNTGQNQQQEKKKLEDELTKLRRENEALRSKLGKPIRRRLPNTRPSITHKASICGHDFYLTAGLFPDGTPGEVFITSGKEGSTVSGLMDTVAVLTSMSLQYGVPLDDIVNKLAYTKFDPQGFTGNPELHSATSPVDYIFRWLQLKFSTKIDEAQKQPELLQDQGGPKGTTPAPGAHTPQVVAPSQPALLPPGQQELTIHTMARNYSQDAPPCPKCGAITVRNGACFKCFGCGESLGCS